MFWILFTYSSNKYKINGRNSELVSLMVNRERDLCVYICRERERLVYIWIYAEGFKPESFSLKANPTTFKYKIHSVNVDLHYLKYVKIKNQVFWILFTHPLSRRKINDRNSELASLMVYNIWNLTKIGVWGFLNV